MTQTFGSPLAALVGYYDRLESDPNQKVAGSGFSAEKIHFEVRLHPDGKLDELVDIRDRTARGKPIPAIRIVPGGQRSGKGFKPFFCWDNTGYALGRDTKGNPGRASEMFAEFRRFHLAFRDELRDDESFAALCRFLESWEPERAESLDGWDVAAGLNVVFRVRGRTAFVHESPLVRSAWLQRLDPEEGGDGDLKGISLVSGRRESIARLHPLIQGVAGAQTMGAAIVSFNADAFESYGKSQSYNAPVGKTDAFRYTTALKRLLAEGDRRVAIGDATVVFWSDRADAAKAESILHEFFRESTPKADSPAEEAQTVSLLREFLKAARQGRLAEQVGDPEAPFYILGLSPNASRLSVRFWMPGTVRLFSERLARHVADLEMTGAWPGSPPLIIRGLISEVMPATMSPESQKKYVAHLAGEIARAVLGGHPYPQALLNAVLLRIRSESTINHARAAIIKAWLLRNRGKEISVALDKNHADEAYHLGRLFAALEKTQEDADPKIKATIKDRFFGAAGAAPASVFPRLIRLHQHHLNKIEKVGQRVNRKKLVGEICDRISRFSAHLGLERQGLFYLGYYHQRQDLFTNQATDDKETTDE